MNKKETNQKPKMDWTYEKLTKNQRAMLRFQIKNNNKTDLPTAYLRNVSYN